MTPARFRQVRDLFHQACDLDDAERASFLERACADNAALRAEVESLLAQDGDGDGSLGASDTPLGQRLLADSPADEVDALKQIGSYKLIRRLGTGGMGIVYLAEQERPRRQVALKVIRPGVATPSTLRRFALETQMLGMLQHPGIAQIFDASTADTGHGPQPFFAMELVKGRPLTEHASSENLGTSQRLALFAKVCDAVQHAHVKGVIHRDLKPSNILVDESGQPKILDFGVARAVGADVQLTMRTDVGQLIGTIQYMSPEQVDGDSRALDTRSDVYSLGVVMYELLAERLPYDVTTTSLPQAARIIQEETPHRLSSIDRALRGDVETIALKALEKDRDRRYQSAAELAADLRRYLNHQPIAARPPTARYQVQMFARRNKALVAAMMSIMLILALAAVVSTTFAVQAVRARKTAECRAYLANIVAAEAALQANDVAGASLRLEDTAPEQRNWEWHHLVGRVDQSVRTFRGHEDAVTAVAFSPDGTRVASGSGELPGQDHTVRLWDVRTGEEIHKLEGHDSSVHTVAFGPDGLQIASGSHDATLKLWDAFTGREIMTLRGHSGLVASVAYVPDGAWLASGSTDKTVRLWDTSTGGELAVLSGHTDAVSAVAVSPDGALVGSASTDGTASLWDRATGRRVHSLLGHTARVHSVAFSPDGKLLATGGLDKTVRIWNITSGENLATLRGHGGPVNSVAFSPDGTRLASVGRDKTLKLWDPIAGQEVASLRGHTNEIRSVDFSSDGAWIVTGSSDRTLKLWDATDLDDIPTLRGHTGLVRSVAFTPDGTRVASASFDGTVKLWDVATRTEVATLHGNVGGIQSVAISPDGRLVAGSCLGRTVELSFIKLWNIETGEEIARLAGHGFVTFNPDGTRLASGGTDNIARLWDVSTGEELLALEGHTGWLWSVAFSPDGERLASASGDNTIKLWDVATGRDLATLRGHTGEVCAVTFSQDGARIASGGGDATVRVWDSTTGAELATLRGHGHTVHGIAFNPDGTRLASASQDKTVKLWDPTTGEAVVTLRGHTSWVWCVAFSPDGTRIASAAGSYEGQGCTVKLWETGLPIP